MGLVRSILSAVVATCFALSAASVGRPADCASQMAPSGRHQPTRHDPSSPHHQHASSQTCAVHVCCAHLALATPVALADARLGEVAANAGFAAVSSVTGARPAHTLPFAHAPPHLS